ncbi:protein-glutamate methylesterase/protein-glutamine glutaminase [Paenibacillus caui]|uniref:protein-glutamate methylesterase/protein-glutamine glutaminase n=1 Tax=Paenibacillus caui TaxID=2873927 RepID=UPI001CA89378
MKPYRILVVDDSPFMRKIITDLIEQDPAFWVERTAANGSEALELIKELSPDLVTMDIEMPEMNGLEALRSIMKEHPVPVIMLSGINEQGMRETIMALELGAFDFIRKPSISAGSQGIDEIGRVLRLQIQAAMASRQRRAAREEALKKQAEEPSALPQPLPGAGLGKPAPGIAAAGRKASAESKAPPPGVWKEPAGPVPPKRGKAPVSPAAKRPRERKAARPSASEDAAAIAVPPAVAQPPAANNPKPAAVPGRFQHIVAVGCSTGGPKALKVLLESLPGNFPAPIVIVQHMPPSFTKSLAQRLNSLSPLTVVEAEQGMALDKGTAYIAPGGKHTRITQGEDGICRISLRSDELRNGHRPSVDVMYESLLTLESLHIHAVLLTGMGSDGAKAMKQLYDQGVTSTIAESEESCVVYGMPRSAVELGCVHDILPLHEIAPKLAQIVK